VANAPKIPKSRTTTPIRNGMRRRLLMKKVVLLPPRVYVPVLVLRAAVPPLEITDQIPGGKVGTTLMSVASAADAIRAAAASKARAFLAGPMSPGKEKVERGYWFAFYLSA